MTEADAAGTVAAALILVAASVWMVARLMTLLERVLGVEPKRVRRRRESPPESPSEPPGA